jgi:serine/threonine protein kinase
VSAELGADEALRADLLARSRALEEACNFAAAAVAARDGGDLGRALHLASLGADAALVDELVERIASIDTDLAERIGEDMLARGHARAAGKLLLRAAKLVRAGEAFAAANAPIEAANAFERAGKPGDGARVLDTALKANPDAHDVRLVLAELLARHGRVEGAVRALQQLPAGSLERRIGLPLLGRSLRALGLDEAARAVDEEAELLGVDPVAEGAVPDVGTEPAKGAVMFGRFEVIREVARTPHARLVETFDRVAQRSSALKLLAASQLGTGRDALIRFEREARALAQLRHPSIVPLIAYIPEGPAIALEWMPGGSLADLLERETVAPARAVEIVGAVLGALGVAHRLGILHRDVKPSNVLFDAIGSPRLSDFGAAHLGDGQNTATAGAIGTFAYMSPEQRLGRPATVRSDVYAAGALLYEMITGAPAEPYDGGELELPPSACHPDMTAAHDTAISTMLRRDANQRPADTFEARQAIEAIAWPRDVVVRAERASGRPRASVPPTSRPDRLAPPRAPADDRDGERLAYDSWTSRHVVLVPLDDLELARGRAFARCTHPALPLVLRAVRTEGLLWVARAPGRSVADGAVLAKHHLVALHAALAELHEIDGGHGAIDDAHLYVTDDDELAIAYPRTASEADDRERDRKALALIAGV